MRDIIDAIDELRFQSQTEKRELSHLYEAKIKNIGILKPRHVLPPKPEALEAWKKPLLHRAFAGEL
ncbi:MAG: hypothetical protein ACKVY0_11785 [Prosthecobacter sp.]|uniref:hypothetical protein n=1 Tax=Prosthecobacter sp. TaxID=1965333 RepID=UPI003900F73D